MSTIFLKLDQTKQKKPKVSENTKKHYVHQVMQKKRVGTVN